MGPIDGVESFNGFYVRKKEEKNKTPSRRWTIERYFAEKLFELGYTYVLTYDDNSRHLNRENLIGEAKTVCAFHCKDGVWKSTGLVIDQPQLEAQSSPAPAKAKDESPIGESPIKDESNPPIYVTVPARIDQNCNGCYKFDEDKNVWTKEGYLLRSTNFGWHISDADEMLCCTRKLQGGRTPISSDWM